MSMSVLITGASGLVATELILELLKATDNELLLLTRDKIKLEQRYEGKFERLKIVNLEELGGDDSLKFDICIHTGFARSSEGAQIVSSLFFLQKLSEICRERGCKRFVNISSQSVYGNDYQLGIAEDGACSPDYMYALGKYASEIICDEAFRNSSICLYNIRLASVCENARFLTIFVENALKDVAIELTAPNQVVSFIDVRDVADALIRLINDKSAPAGIYNLGSGQWYTIKHIADIVKTIGEKEYNISNVRIVENDCGKRTHIGMNITKIESTLGWRPNYDLKDMIISIYELLTNANGGGVPTSL